jgi:hypothetical protein
LCLSKTFIMYAHLVLCLFQGAGVHEIRYEVTNNIVRSWLVRIHEKTVVVPFEFRILAFVGVGEENKKHQISNDSP